MKIESHSIFGRLKWPAILLVSLQGCQSTSVAHGGTGTTDTTAHELVQSIESAVNPDYQYEYENTKLVPAGDKILYTVGLDKASIEQFAKDFKGKPLPAGWGAYWSVTSTDSIITDTPSNTGDQSGYNNHQWLTDQFPNAAIMSGMWMVGTWDIAQQTAQGVNDENIRFFCRWAASLPNPIYLRPGYEFDGPHNELDPEIYKQAYRRTFEICQSESASNVAFVWHSYAAPPYEGHDIEAWYPGDDVVHWVGISTYGQLYGTEVSQDVLNLINFARDHKKPVMISESSAIKGVESKQDWDRWFRPFFEFILTYNIKAFTYNNTNWPAFPAFQNFGWQNGELQSSDLISDAWHKVLSSDRFITDQQDIGDLLIR